FPMLPEKIDDNADAGRGTGAAARRATSDKAATGDAPAMSDEPAMSDKAATSEGSAMSEGSASQDGEPAEFIAAASVRGVSKSFKRTRVLEDVSFDVGVGEALVLLGASGSGKTTILRIIAGLEQPDSGQVILHGRDVTDLPARERGVGVIFQSYALFPRMTVEENVGYGLRIRGRSRREVKEKVARLLKLVHLEEHRKKFPTQLSGGQQQRVAIARTLAYEPQVLLFDEPFGALDAQTRVRLRREIRALLREVNVPAVFITHDQEEALELGDRIAVLHAGHLEQIGTPEEVYNRPETEYVATFLGAANLLLGVVGIDGRVELGMASIEASEEAARFREGQSVKLVFRPEDVQLSPLGDLPEGCRHLTNGVIEEKHFVGAYERLTVRLDIIARHPAGDEPPLYDVTINTPEKRPGVPIFVTRPKPPPKPETNASALRVGDRVAVCLTVFRVLPNFALASERGSRILDANK
ncbi:MAG: sulfate/thiosulfate transport system ATP-binding protein, partial [Acidobacteriota bacterium]|nr:sulfate/thiosulfate transport system ATP-binding protein [Acidobacteriota bacterium]